MGCLIIFFKIFFIGTWKTDKVSQEVKVLVAKPENLSLIMGIHMVEVI